MRIVLFSSLAMIAAFAQPPKFAVADVHVSKTAYWFAQGAHSPSIRDGIYIYRDATVLDLIRAAYEVPEDLVVGGPSWIKSDLYDVVAKIPEGATAANIPVMLQALLAERLGLDIRKELRPTKGYVLSVAKSGSKLKRAAPGEPGCKQELVGVGGRGDGKAAPAPIILAQLPNFKFTCRGLTSRQIADNLRQMAGGYTTYLDHEVKDETGLDGMWDFELEFTPPQVAPDKGRDAITIFDAVNKQLGLSLDLQDVQTQALVVRSVNRKPSPNPPAVDAALALAAPRFEVAAIKPLEQGQGQARPISAGFNYTGGSQMRVMGTLKGLIAQAFQIQPNAAGDVILGLPKFAETKMWEITAKLPSAGEGSPGAVGGRQAPPTLSVALEMLRALLVERFELKTHTENREVTVYALTVDGKPKLTKADPNERSDCRPDPNAPKPFPNLGVMVNCKNITMAEFARNLEQATGFFDHPIVDETGLEGGWSFYLGWSRQQAPRAPQPGQPAAADVDPSAYMTSYEAVQRQLGLKLVSRKRSIPVLVVDHVAEEPVE